ncbi:MAG: phosphoribosylaminoimidazolesuccinocarboxamide synthase [Longimicrobiales bacterium]|nr:phosphoribosylaminoimidazolesuccinocarboxamide synthase [Longimicrobiales bacterium]
MNPPRQPPTLDLPLLRSGKVRDIFVVGPDRLLMVASDRISAYDVVLPQPIPRKGAVVTQLTSWWLRRLERDLGVAHHAIAVLDEAIVAEHPELARSRSEWSRRSMLVKRATPVLVECVVRGYLAGSAWKEYRERGTLAGEMLPRGLSEDDRLDTPIFTPATKAQEGHDENISFDEMAGIVGPDVAAELRARSMEIYNYAHALLDERGILLADTKFEFGFDANGRLLLIDEVLTPDSSRFWPKDTREPGHLLRSLDKQPVRDWLDALPDWDRMPPAPDLPPEIIAPTSARYMIAFERITGMPLSRWTAPIFQDGA